MRRLAAALCVLAFAACPGRKGDAGGSDPGRDGGAPAERVGGAEASDGGTLVLTAEKLERYIQYQERALPLQAQMLQEVAKLDARGDAGMPANADGGRAPPAVIRAVRKHAEAQARLREEWGLTASEVREIERLVGDVIAQRVLAASTGERDDSLQQMEQLSARLPDEDREEFQATLHALKAQQQQTDALTDQRRAWGDANVDLVLSREKDLLRQWNDAVATYAGTAPPARRRNEDGGTRPPSPDAGR